MPLIEFVTQHADNDNEDVRLYNFVYAMSLVSIFSEYGSHYDYERHAAHAKICRTMKKYEEAERACSHASEFLGDDDRDKVSAIIIIYESLEEAQHKAN